MPATLVSVSGVVLFGAENHLGYGILALGLVTAAFIDRALLRHLALVAAGMVIISAVPLNADLSTQHIVLMGGALALAVLVPWLVSRFVYGERIIRFPVKTGRKWPLTAKLYLAGVVVLGYFILPAYLIRTGVYQNWPDATDPAIFWRLFLGVNAVGIWDELFFICTAFTLLRQHFPDWLANILQAVIFSSFLWEIGYQSWGPLLTFPFALLQGYTFKLTKSLTYVVAVHLRSTSSCSSRWSTHTTAMAADLPVLSTHRTARTTGGSLLAFVAEQVVPAVGEHFERVVAVWLEFASRPKRGDVVELGERERSPDVVRFLREAAGQLHAADDVGDDLLMPPADQRPHLAVDGGSLVEHVEVRAEDRPERSARLEPGKDAFQLAATDDVDEPGGGGRQAGAIRAVEHGVTRAMKSLIRSARVG